MFRPGSQLLAGSCPARLARLAALTAGLWAMGCQPKIGDECETAIDCSTLGDRLCDTSQPGGYCTVFNCEPDSCEDEAVCVAFDTELDPACKEADDGRYGRFGRTFCMRKCNDDGDCRDQYRCVLPGELASTVIDTETDADRPQLQKYCIADGPAPMVGEGAPPNACYPNGETELPPPHMGTGGMGTGGMGTGGMGTGGMGAGGMGTGGMGTGGMGTGGSGGA